jgi:hypothetical protein
VELHAKENKDTRAGEEVLQDDVTLLERLLDEKNDENLFLFD